MDSLKILQKHYEDEYLSLQDRRDVVIIESWITGGFYYGGVEKEPEIEGNDLENLDIILEMFWPNISILQYNKLCRKIIKYGCRTDDIGHSLTEYGVKFLFLKELYNYLEDENDS